MADAADIARSEVSNGAAASDDTAPGDGADIHADASEGAAASSDHAHPTGRTGETMPSQTACPRCGYDLSGSVAAWTDSCPIGGTCSECGLTFHWRDLLVESRRRDWTLFEHAQGGLFKAMLGTLMMTLTPTRLWRRVRLEMAIDFPRLIAIVVWAVLLMYAARTALAIVHRTLEYLFYQHRVAWIGMQGPWFEYQDLWLEVLWPETLLGKAQVDLSKFNWGLVPSVAWLMLLAWALAPLCFALLPQTVRRCKVRRDHLLRVTLYMLPTLVLTLSVSWLLLDVLAALADYQAWTGWRAPAWLPSYYRTQSVLASWRLVPATAVGALWMFWWWRCACGRYLRLPHASGVAAAIVALSLLVATGIFVMLGGGPSLLDDLAVVTKPILPW